ncbi:hypothetical protein, partial [Rhizobium brockwellii]|uniref:hypothetical protein n=1 Tax=Rhizobium brockwellii TaxID=3019932 RepID=UPI003F9962A8
SNYLPRSRIKRRISALSDENYAIENNKKPIRNSNKNISIPQRIKQNTQKNKNTHRQNKKKTITKNQIQLTR